MSFAADGSISFVSFATMGASLVANCTGPAPTMCAPAHENATCVDPRFGTFTVDMDIDGTDVTNVVVAYSGGTCTLARGTLL